MQLFSHLKAVQTHYRPTIVGAVIKTYLSMLVRNRFINASASGTERVLGSKFSYSKRASLYGMFREIFIEQNYYIEPTEKPLTIIDCGTNIGISLLYFRTQAPNATITAFEPNPHTYKIVQSNVANNNLQVTIYPVGLGKEKTVATFHTDAHDLASQSGSTTGHLATKNYEMTSFPVSIELLSPYITGPVDILKLDVEGAEGEVLEELLERNVLHHIKQIFVEYHYDGVHTTYPFDAVLNTLEKGGFTYAVNSQIELPYVIPKEAVCFSYKIVAWRNEKLISAR